MKRAVLIGQAALWVSFLFAVALLLAVDTEASTQAEQSARPDRQDPPPNVVLILADDLGIGDVGSYNPDSQIPTPHLDRLARQGRRFTDAHSPGSVCVPTRYGLMTGRSPVRKSMNSSEGPVIDSGQATIASLFGAAGYETAMVGKWHLGFEGGDEFDCSAPLEGGPVDRGFDQFFGMHASLDIPPYFYVEGKECVAAPSQKTYGRSSSRSYWNDIQGPFWRGGSVAPGFRHATVLTRWRERAVAFLEDQHRTDQRREEESSPFFLYLALTAPHTPWLPVERFQGTSEAGMYGDFVVQVDDLVGRVLSSLDRLGMRENTLVIVTSDNGPVWYPKDEKRFGHRATGQYRGMKGDVWEGGHRMPFLVRWPGHVPAGTVSEEPLMFTDLLATFAALTGEALPSGATQDSHNMLPAFLGTSGEKPIRKVMVHPGGYLAVREGPWKLIPGLGSGGFSEPQSREPEPGEPSGQLYNLEEDPGETNNLYAERPAVVERLSKLLEKYRQAQP